MVIVGVRFHIYRELDATDFLHDGEITALLAYAELYLGVISACLPYLSPPLSRIWGTLLSSGIVSRFSSRSGRDSTDASSFPGQNDSFNLRGTVGQMRGPFKGFYASSRRNETKSSTDLTCHDVPTLPQTWEAPSEFSLRLYLGSYDDNNEIPADVISNTAEQKLRVHNGETQCDGYV